MTNENGEVECGCEENFQLAANGKDCVGELRVPLAANTNIDKRLANFIQPLFKLCSFRSVVTI